MPAQVFGWFLLTLTLYEAKAFKPPVEPGLANFDRRIALSQAAANVTAEQRSAATKLERSSARVRVEFEPILGTPKMVAGGREFLTAPNGAAKAGSAQAASGFGANETNKAIKAFLREQRQLFGFGPEALDKAHVKRDFQTPHNGLRTVVWEQHVDGVPLFEGILISHTTKNGELASVSSQFVPDPAGAADRGTPNRTAAASRPNISAAEAVAIAARNLGEQAASTELSVVATPPGPSGPANDPEKRQRFKGKGIQGEAEVKLVWLPMSKDKLRLCWEVMAVSRARGEMYRVLVDAASGEPMVRHCLTAYISDATYRVFTSDSPSPFSPGLSIPSATQPPLISSALVTLSALDTNASPSGWIEDGVTETLGNNVDAHTDLDHDNQPDLPRPDGGINRVFDFSMDLTTEDPSSYHEAAVVNLFYWCNWMHDRLYELGFTEAAGNFQNNNFGRGGVGNDAVQADAQDGSGFNNANFSTPTDGSPGRMQMYIFGGASPRRDGDLDAEVILHEYTHGLSNRRVGGGVLINALQTMGMGEGWSDFYALSLLSEAGDDPNGNYAMGAYASDLLGGLTENYYYGIRRYPYTTDMMKNPLTFKDIDGGQASSHPGVPRSSIIGYSASELHNQGEIWCVTLWEARALLINKYGGTVGNQLMLQLVTDGMNLAPPNPTFLQARDAILQADLVDTGGTNHVELWAAFAKRGMGFSATCPASFTTAGVLEAFDLPDDLRIQPGLGFIASGPAGGPFDPNLMTLTLTNLGTNTLAWALANTSSWLHASSGGGTISGSSAITAAISLDSSATNLPPAVYADSLVFTNASSTNVQMRQFILRIGQPDVFTELFEAGDNNLAFRSLTFTPDGGTSFYSLCRESASAFPTDPIGGNQVGLTDDDFVQVTLSGTNTVSIYGQRTNVFFIGSNGYLTLNLGDRNYIESTLGHFNLPRVSALFHDLNPEVNGTISWKELNDRVVVTFQNVPAYGAPLGNDFQIELFYDGRVRLTYLGLHCLSNLTGLSAGAGVPFGFVESHFSAYGLCPAVPVLPLDHFAWSHIPSPQSAGIPFTVTLEARDSGDALVTNFAGTVFLGVTNGGAALTPAFSGNFAQGLWTGSVTIATALSNAVLSADDGFGHAGLATVSVGSAPHLGMQFSGNTLLILWPAGAPLLNLETTTNLQDGVWTPVLGPVLVGDQYQATAVIDEPSRFFRLRYTP